jgi:hypothetical protein
MGDKLFFFKWKCYAFIYFVDHDSKEGFPPYTFTDICDIFEYIFVAIFHGQEIDVSNMKVPTKLPASTQLIMIPESRGLLGRPILSL